MLTQPYTSLKIRWGNKENNKMTEPNSETTQEQVNNPANEVVIQPANEQGTAGAPATPAPSKTNEGQENQSQTQAEQPKSKITPEDAQRRIDRMYARLQQERRDRIAVETQLKARTAPTQVSAASDPNEEGTTQPVVKPLTEADIEAVLERKERSRKVVESELRVFEQHPSALNEDGSYNAKDPFVVKYMEVARNNPGLAMMDDGPELAAAMVDKQLGLDYRKGRVDEARRTTQTNNAHTTTSTVTPAPNALQIQLSTAEQKIARNMRMTDKEYFDSKNSSKVPQKSWEVKAR
jgi:hypothetical protein